MGDIEKETHSDAGTSGGSLQLIKSSSEFSSSISTDQASLSSEVEGKKDISYFESRYVSSQKLTLSEDHQSLSSNYASTSSSHRSVDTPSIPSSPEQLIPTKFVRPRMVAPVQKHDSSSEGGSSDNAKEVSPKQRKLPHKVKFSESSGISESSGDSQEPFPQQNSTPAELSSREVTHLDPPDLKSTPVEVSMDYVQFSGESHKLTTSSYSLPDPFYASPSEDHFSEPFDDDNKQTVASRREREQQQDVTERSHPIDHLPKWVTDEKQKQMDFGSMQSSESINSADLSSSPAASSLGGSIFQNRKFLSLKNENALLSTSPELLVEDSQSTDVQNVYEEDIEESCVYDVQECPKRVLSTSANLIPASGKTKEGLSDRINDSHIAIVASPNLLQLSSSSAVSSSTQTSQGVPLLISGSTLDLQSQKEEEAFKIKHSWVLHESVVTEKEDHEASTSGKEDVAGKNDKESPISTGICSYVPGMERSTKELSPAHTSMTKGMELEMSQDLFNEKLEQIETADYDPLLVVQDTGVENRDQDFRLFLSQTQNMAAPSFEASNMNNTPSSISLDPVPLTNKAASAHPSCAASQTREELPLNGQRNSFDNTLATPSQSILSNDRKMNLSLPTIAPVNAEMEINQAEGLDIPKDVLNKVSSGELSLSNRVHISPTSDDGPFRPIKTLTPPLRNITLITEPSQDVCNKTTVDQSEESLAAAPVAECLHSTAMESRTTRRTEVCQENSNNPTSFASPSNIQDLQAKKDASSKQGSMISSRIMKTVAKAPKRSHPASSIEGDPFVFNEEDDAPQTKTRRITVEPSQKSLRLETQDARANSEGKILCKVVNRIITTKTVTRQFITELLPIDNSDGTVYRRTEFVENEAPSKSVFEECHTEIIEVEPFSVLDLKKGRQQTKQKKTPKMEVARVRKSTRKDDRRLEDTQLVAFEETETSSKVKRQTRSSTKGFGVGASSIDVGMHVLGKWLDNCYYPGKVIEMPKQGRYKVRFHDGRELLVGANVVIPQHNIQPGHSVCARDDKDGYYYRGTTHSIDRTSNGIHSCYHIKLDGSDVTRKFDASDIMLDSKQISQLTAKGCNSSKNKKKTSIADTHSHTKRKSNEKEARLADPEPGGTQLKETKSVKSKKIFTKMRSQKEESANLLFSSSSSVSDSFQYKFRPKRKIAESSSKKQVAQSSNSQLQSMGSTVDDPVEKSSDRGEKIERLKNDPNFEEIILQNSTLFKGYTFLITYIQPKSVMKDETAFRCKNFKRSHLICQITAGGGMIVENVKNLQTSSSKNIILIAPKCQKTLKYYFALCYGFPCLSHFWVIDSCKENQLLPFDNYLLEAGIDEVTGTMVPPHKRTQPLRGYKIYVKALDRYQEELSLAVKFSGAELLHKLPKVKAFCPGDLDFILVGDNVVLKRDFISLSKKLDVPCVTVKWFFQCIIHGEFIIPQTSQLFSAL